MKLLLFATIATLSLPAFGATPKPAAPAPTETRAPNIKGNAIIQQRLDEIDALISKKDFSGAIQAAMNQFNLNASMCRGIDTYPINFKDPSGNEIVAHTRLDQLIVLDPRQVVFRNARFLISVLAHEIAHCDQNQKMYEMSLSMDKVMAPLKDKVPLLRVLADLDELANIAIKDTPVKAESQAKFKIISAKHGLEMTPEALVALSKRFLENVAIYKSTLGELHEMEASLRAFDLPAIIPPPSMTDEKASDEFSFQFRFLLLSTNKFLRARTLMGTPPDSLCKLVNAVPFGVALQQERNCVESIRLIQTYFSKVPN